MSSLATIRDTVEQDLHDETNVRWTTAVLDRHIKHAVLDYSQVSPLEQKNGLTTTPGSRDVSITSLVPRIRVTAVEYPTAAYPPNFVPFSLWNSIITLDLISPPAGAESIQVYWHKVHTINGGGTFDPSHDDIIAVGAAGYAALDTASFATDRINVGGDNVWGKYQEFGEQRLTQFRKMLRDLPVANTLRTGQLYTPAGGRLRSQTTDPGPL
jgi:hypothetical protein